MGSIEFSGSDVELRRRNHANAGGRLAMGHPRITTATPVRVTKSTARTACSRAGGYRGYDHRRKFQHCGNQ